MAAKGAVTNKDHQRLSLEACRVAAWEWHCRHGFELEARSRFARLTDALKAHHAAEPIVALTARAAQDEHRHAHQCRDIIAHLGGKVPEDQQTVSKQIAPERMSDRAALLYEMVAMSCVTETLSCTILSALVERTDNPFLKQSMRSILSDEVNHSRLGWAYLADVKHRGPARLISDYLPAMLAGTVSEELFDEEASHLHTTELDGLGVLNRADRLRIFLETMRTVVFPGLEQYGIDTAAGERWLSAMTTK